jgi:hypothetical protein
VHHTVIVIFTENWIDYVESKKSDGEFWYACMQLYSSQPEIAGIVYGNNKEYVCFNLQSQWARFH